MPEAQIIKIAFRKEQFVRLFITACIFSPIGFWLFHLDSQYINSVNRHFSPIYVHFIGLAVLFMGLCGIAISLKMLLSKTPGLVIDSEGIDIIITGKVYWREITGFKAISVYQQNYLYILLKSPNDYIARCNPVHKFLLKALKGSSPGPVGVAEKLLNIDFDTLIKLLNDQLKEHQRPSQTSR